MLSAGQKTGSGNGALASTFRQPPLHAFEWSAAQGPGTPRYVRHCATPLRTSGTARPTQGSSIRRSCAGRAGRQAPPAGSRSAPGAQSLTRCGRRSIFSRRSAFECDQIKTRPKVAHVAGVVVHALGLRLLSVQARRRRWTSWSRPAPRAKNNGTWPDQRAAGGHCAHHDVQS